MPDAPVTLEGWYTLHEMFAVDWGRWNALEPTERTAIVADAQAALERLAAPGDGHSAPYALVSHKGDLCLVHWRRDLEALRAQRPRSRARGSAATCRRRTRTWR